MEDWKHLLEFLSCLNWKNFAINHRYNSKEIDKHTIQLKALLKRYISNVQCVWQFILHFIFMISFISLQHCKLNFILCIHRGHICRRLNKKWKGNGKVVQKIISLAVGKSGAYISSKIKVDYRHSELLLIKQVKRWINCKENQIYNGCVGVKAFKTRNRTYMLMNKWMP